MVQNRSLFVLLMLAAMTLPPTLARQAISAVSVAQTPDAPDTAAPTPDTPEGIDPFEGAPPVDAAPPTETSPAPLPPAFSLPESLPAGTTLSIDGSVSMAAINRTLIRRFEERFPGVTVVVQEQGTAAALQGLAAGDGPDLAAVGRPLSQEELAQGLVEIPISREKIAIIVGDENPFQGDLTFDQFAQIFRGEIANWLYVGGPDVPIRFIDRPADSDTRRALGSYDIFKAVEFSTGENAIALEADDTAAVVEALGSSGISYAIASQVLDQDNVRALTMDGTLPDDPRYPYSQPRGYAYTGTPSPAAAAFLAFATSTDGQAALVEAKSAEAADVATAELPTSVTAMRPNGQGFVTGDREGNIKFWNIDGSSAGEPEEAAHTGPVTALAFSPDGNRIISGGADGKVRFWDAVGTPVGEPIAAHGDPVSTLAVFPDGTFATGSTDGSLRRWDTNGTPVGEPIAAHGDSVRAATVSGDGQTLVTAANDGQVKLWNPDGTAKGEFGGHEGPVTAVAVKPDNTLVTGGKDSTVRLWDSAGAPQGSHPTAGPVTALAVSADGQQIATGDGTGTVQMRNGDGTPAGDPVSDIGSAVDGLAFTPDGERLVVSAQDQPPQLRNQAGELVSQAAPEAGPETEEVEGNLAGLWQRLQSLGPRLWILLPILLLAILLWSLLQGVFGDSEDDDEEETSSSSTSPEVAGSDEDLDVPPTSSGEDIDWSVADGSSDVDFGQTDLGQADFGADFEPGDDLDIDFGGEPVSFDSDIPNAIAAVPPAEAAQGLDSRLSKAKAALGRGLELAQAGNLQDALDSTNQAIESADVERLKALGAGVSLAGVGAIIARGMTRRGGILSALERPEDALKSYDRALQLEPNDPDAWVGKGKLLLTLNRSDEALFCFDKAIELNSDLGAAWQGKGQALQQMNRSEEAQAALTQAKTLGPDTDEPSFAPLKGGIGAALGGGVAALGALGALRPDPIVDDAEDQLEDDLPADLQAALGDLPETADTPDPHAPEAPPIEVPEEVDSLWVETDAEAFENEDATIIQGGSGVPTSLDQRLDQGSDDETMTFPVDDGDDETLGFSIEVDSGSDEVDKDTIGFSLEQEDVEAIDFDFGEADEGSDPLLREDDDTLAFALEPGDILSNDDEGSEIDLEGDHALVDFSLAQSELDDIDIPFKDEAVDFSSGPSEDDDLSLDLGDGDGFEISLAPSDDDDLDIDLESNNEPLDFSLDSIDSEVEAPELTFDDDAIDLFSEPKGSGEEATEDAVAENILDADIPEEVFAALQGISGFVPEETVVQQEPTGTPPPPPPRRPVPPPLPSNPKLEAD